MVEHVAKPPQGNTPISNATSNGILYLKSVI
jgi:hypothetical protein